MNKEETTMNYDAELDCRGLVCPVPALKTKKELAKMAPGKVLRVVTDYKPASESVPRDLAKTPNKLLGIEYNEDESVWYIFFQAVK
nr:sulfurtransferase TusA family protein [Candidatus Sigynarchaeum springense]